MKIKGDIMTSSKQQGGVNWTEVTLTAGDRKIPAVLNDSRASRELITRLPFTVKLS